MFNLMSNILHLKQIIERNKLLHESSDMYEFCGRECSDLGVSILNMLKVILVSCTTYLIFSRQSSAHNLYSIIKCYISAAGW